MVVRSHPWQPPWDPSPPWGALTIVPGRRDPAARMSDRKPLLLVDIDGVLNPFVPEGEPLPSGYVRHTVAGQRVLLRLDHGMWLRALAARFELVWVSTWEAEANTLVGPLIGAPPDLPYIRFSERTADGWTWKLPAVRRFAGDRPLAWLDDDPGPDVAAWAATRGAPTLVVSPDPRAGWTEVEYRRLVAFAADADRPAD